MMLNSKRMFWITAITLPIISIFCFWYAVVTPWFCSGLCCIKKNKCAEVSVKGSLFEQKYEPVVKVLQRSLTSGWDLGASLFVAVDGNTVLDVAGGFKDKDKLSSYEYDTSTLNVVFSSGKVIETIAIAMLADRGLLDLEAPVSKYWPEFAQNEKGEITVKDILSHRSGSSFTFDETPAVEVLQDRDQRDSFIAKQKNLYPRGTVSYRAWGSAFISDAICRRVDPQSRTLERFIRDELFDKLEEEYYTPPSLTEKKWSTISKLHDISLSTLIFGLLPQIFLPGVYSNFLPNGHPLKLNAQDAIFFQRAISKQKHADGYSFFDQPNIPGTDKGAASYNDRLSFLSYDMMSGNSISNARAIGKAFDAFMNGKIVRDETLSEFTAQFPPAYDRVLTINVTYTAGGFGVTPNLPLGIKSTTCSGWFGIGGSVLLHCLIGNHKATISYVMNTMSPMLAPLRGVQLLEELVAVLLADSE
jgi:CubicO group peptidase (beta-lactamase class C family)